MDPVPRLLPLTSPKARREGRGEGVSAQAGHLLLAPWGRARPGPSRGFSPAAQGQALIPGRVCVSVRGPGAWSPSHGGWHGLLAGGLSPWEHGEWGETRQTGTWAVGLSWQGL